MGLSGLEPPTSRLSGVRSNRLSYKPIYSGSHLLSRAVSSKVPSAAWVLTIVFGMGTGVAPKRIATGSGLLSKPAAVKTKVCCLTLTAPHLPPVTPSIPLCSISGESVALCIQLCPASLKLRFGRLPIPVCAGAR